MKIKIYIIGSLIAINSLHGQVGIRTENPQGPLHVDGAKDNPTTGAPSAAQQANDFIVTSNGRAGIGILAPTEKMEVNGNIKINNSSSTYGSYLQAENSEGVKMTIQATESTTSYGARGILGTTSAHPLQLIYNASPVVYMDNGTLAPNGTNLTFLGSDLNRWNGVFAGGGGFNAKNASGLYVGLQAESQNGVQAIFGASANASNFGPVAYIGTKTNHQVAFLANNVPVMYMNSDGFYPNGNNSKSLGYVGTGALTQVVAYAFTNPSDIRFKKNIENLNYGIDDIMKIRSVSYDLKDDKNDKKLLGFIAQEMEKIIPEIVTTNQDKDAYKAIDYVKLIPVLVKAIQDQETTIESQKKDFNALQSIVDQQNKDILELKKLVKK